jgi:uncharacterized protein YdaU (DUF1376 family)
MDWYPRNPRKFDMGTLGWTLAERGAYSCLVDAYYENEGPLPADEGAIAATLRVDLETWRVIAGKVLGKFEVRDGLLYHEVCDKELATQRRLSERSRENGRKGGRPKRDEKQDHKPTGLAVGTPEITQTKPQDITGQDNTNSSLRSELVAVPALALEPTGLQADKPKPVKGTRMTEDMALPEPWESWARQEGHPDPAAEWERFRDYWIGVAGKDGVKTNWKATWRNRVRSVMQNGRAAVGRKPAATNTPITAEEAIKRVERYVKHFKHTGDWNGDGPKPGDPNCQVPVEILAKYGYTQTGANS